MIKVKTIKAFDDWIARIDDPITRMRLKRRLEKAQEGNLGKGRNLKGGISEMIEDFGPGWRMYYTRRGSTLIIMLGGGEKSTQSADIAKAYKIASMLED